MTEKELVDALLTVKSFYQDSFQQLFQYSIGLIALVGIIVPLVAGLLNWRNLKSEKESLEKTIKGEIQLAREELKIESKKLLDEKISEEISKLNEKIDAKVKALSATIDQKSSKLEGASFHLQGNSRNHADAKGLALGDYCYAAEKYLKGNDEANAKTVMNVAISCLKSLNKSDFDKYESEFKKSESLIKYLEGVNINGRYTNEINSLKSEIKESKSREPTKK